MRSVPFFVYEKIQTTKDQEKGRRMWKKNQRNSLTFAAGEHSHVKITVREIRLVSRRKVGTLDSFKMHGWRANSISGM